MFTNTAFSLRWRNALESFDAGMLLFRLFFARIWLFFLPPFLALVVTFAILPVQWVWLGFLLVWWLHPLWDRLVIHPLAVLFFDPNASISEFRKDLFFRLTRGLVGDLSWRRFSMVRTFILPIRTLEKRTGGQLRSRTAALSDGIRGSIFLLLAVVSVCQVGLVSSEFSFITQITQFLPAFMQPDVSMYSPGFFRFVFVAYAMHSLLLIPLRCCMTFSFYLNRRITLEGWDIELSFREYVKGLVSALPSHERGSSPNVIVLLAMVFLIMIPGSATARQNDSTAETRISVPLDDLEEILGSEDFGGMRERPAFRWKAERGSGREGFDLFERFPAFERFDIPAWTLRSVLIAAALILVGWIAWINRQQLWMSRWLRGRRGDEETANPLPFVGVEERGGAVTPLGLYASGNRREAWALVYNQLVATLSTRLNLHVGSGATEGDVLSAIASEHANRALVPALIPEVRSVVRSWQHVAYAHHEPEDQQFFQAVAVIDRLKTPDGTER